MPRPLIIGIGNTLRGDDGAGAAVCEQIEIRLRDAADVMIVHQLTPELCAPISAAKHVYFVDARADSPTGTLDIQDLHPHAENASAFTHDVSPQGLLAAARDLYGTYPPAQWVTIGAQSFDFGDALSPEVAEAVTRAADWIVNQITGTR